MCLPASVCLPACQLIYYDYYSTSVNGFSIINPVECLPSILFERFFLLPSWKYVVRMVTMLSLWFILICGQCLCEWNWMGLGIPLSFYIHYMWNFQKRVLKFKHLVIYLFYFEYCVMTRSLSTKVSPVNYLCVRMITRY